jgi:hypothetical protein
MQVQSVRCTSLPAATACVCVAWSEWAAAFISSNATADINMTADTTLGLEHTFEQASGGGGASTRRAQACLFMSLCAQGSSIREPGMTPAQQFSVAWPTVGVSRLLWVCCTAPRLEAHSTGAP